MFDPASLPWLPPKDPKFREKLKSLDVSTPNVGVELFTLAGCSLNNREATLYNRKLKKLRNDGADLSPLSAFNLSILSNTTIDLVADALPTAAARHGINLTVQTGEYDQVLQEALEPSSSIFTVKPDAILLMLDHVWYGKHILSLDTEAFVNASISRLLEVIQALESSCKGLQIILQTIAVPPTPLFGNFDRRFGGNCRDIDALNNAIVSLCRERGLYLLDVATLAETVGTARYHDPLIRNLYKLPFAQEIVPLFSDWLGRLLGAARGKSRKCLVLDLDNTLWGGAIGDEGLEGIILGQGSPAGEAFLAVQALAKNLKNRGIILAVSSKNNDQTARSAFRDHPEMILKENDIAVFQANWMDKASNIEAIAKTLNIGLDSLVFLDDNPVERATVRQSLPMVFVPEIGNEPAIYPSLLMASGYFDTVSYSSEDKLRAESYAANAHRAEVQAKSRNIGDYLSSLEMEIRSNSFTKIDRGRIVQLINKTNQFNLTTRRYTEAEVIEMEESPAVLGRYSRLKDRFGDFGIIGIVIVKETTPDLWEIDSWLMSCRVLGRKVEREMLNDIVNTAKKNGIKTLTANFIPTAKNSMVSDHFDKLGFNRVTGEQGLAATFSLDLNNFEPEKSAITIIS